MEGEKRVSAACGGSEMWVLSRTRIWAGLLRWVFLTRWVVGLPAGFWQPALGGSGKA